MKRKILSGIVGLVVIGILTWVSIVGYLGCENRKEVIGIRELPREKMGSVSILDTSILDMAPVQGLKVYMKGGDKE